ncbi:hypothetical protein Tdes44962_MAKER00725 [Teratosphaeria destructans]|uniref:Methyltransferase type 11 domain-containing protein n=1 Tax=Teratosphaeria destructans TaxID=418781 RepID=A0A9W7SM27_9PEZI|nr:hypothetical protein Tdes44962_MAKER00725 [Teratosphaeria destructans]
MECASDSTDKNSMKRQGGSDLVCSSLGKSSGSSDSSNPGNGSWYTGTKGSSKPQQEDPWAEYDDLMDAMLPQHTPLSAGSSLGLPFQYADTSCNNSPSFPMPLNLTEPPSAQLPSPPRANTIPAVLSVPQQVARFMQPSLSPLVPRTATLSGILDHYGNESNISLVSSKHSSVPQAAWSSAIKAHGEGGVDKGTSISSQYSRASEHSRSASSPEACARTSQLSLAPSSRTKDTQFLRHPENDESSQMANDTLRFGALMASKWLSFGQVLFSPAHHEMSLAHDPRVLIIDGLGSDWSYYVTLNYPEAEVYNLDVAATSLATSWPGVPKSPQLKLRHIPFSTIAAAFPFPKGFFTAVVLRFPVATTDQAYYACICECKRVLRPGGHLEVAMLDLDLVNMGHRARSVVRGLKTRMQARDPSVSLRNMSDFMVRLIGRRGFEEIKRGVVGVPTARHVSRSRDASSNSSSQSAEQPCRPSLARVNTRQITFTDLLDDARNSQYISDGANDEGVTKLVAKVGRWWYSTCYETPLLGDNKSIWQDQELLRECEKQGTSLRLLLCHAQKPQQTRRRTVSV